MQLKMQIGMQLVGSVPLDKNKITDREYIQEKIQELEIKFAEQMETSFKTPVFYIDTVPSKMNEFNKMSR
jgi:hypothetical protein